MSIVRQIVRCGVSVLVIGTVGAGMVNEPTDQLRADYRNEVHCYTNSVQTLGVMLGTGSGWHFGPEKNTNIQTLERVEEKIFQTHQIPFLQSTLGVPVTAQPANIMLGEEMEIPDGWDGSAPDIESNTGGKAIWVDYAKKLIAVEAGPVRVAWNLNNRTQTQRSGVVSASPVKRPVRLYWTHKRPSSVGDSYEALQNAGPTVTFSSNYRVDLHATSSIGVFDAQRGTVGDVRLNGTELQAFEGAHGTFLVTYSRLDEATNQRVLLAYEIVEVLEPTQTQLDVKIGQQLRPISRTFDTNELFPRVTRGLTDESENGEIYVYQHSSGKQKNYLWAIRDSSDDPWKIEVFWRAKEELDVIWPFEVDIYAASWDKAGAQVYLRDCESAAGGKCAAEPVVFVPTALSVSAMDYQIPEKHLVANNGSLYTTYAGTNAYALVKYSAGETVWFQTIHSVPQKDTALLQSLGCDLSGSVTNQLWWTGRADEERPDPDDLTTAVLAEEIRAPFAGEEGWFYPGWIHFATNRVEGYPILNPFNAAAYTYPTEYVATNEVYAPIFPVNLGQIEVWWSVPSTLNGEQAVETGHTGPVPTPIYFPTIPALYTVKPPDETYRWDNGVPQIVIASPYGSGGWAMSDYDPWVASPTISFSYPWYGSPDHLLEFTLDQNGIPEMENRVQTSANFTVEARISAYKDWFYTSASQMVNWVSFYTGDSKSAYLKLAFDLNANIYIDGERRTNFDSIPVPTFANRSDDMSATQFHLALAHGEDGLFRYYVNGMRVAEFANTNANAAAAITFGGGRAQLFERGEYDEVVSTKTFCGYMSNFRVWSTERSWQSIHDNRHLDLSSASMDLIVQLGEQVKPSYANDDEDQWDVISQLADTSLHQNTFYLGFDPEVYGYLVSAGLYSGAPVKPRPGLTFLSDASIYVQNDPTLPGYNPNEECAMMVGGNVFALECQNNITKVIPFAQEGKDGTKQFTSLPYVLVQYADEKGRMQMAAMRVVPENDMYRFRQFLEAGKKIQAPAPISNLQPANLMTFKEGPRMFTKEERETFNACSGLLSLLDWAHAPTNSILYRDFSTLMSTLKTSRTCFRDRKGWFWAHQAGDTNGPTNYVFELSYPWQPSFYNPNLEEQPAVGTEIAWMASYKQRDDSYLGASSKFQVRDASDADGIDYTYVVEWPRQPAKLYVNQTLYKAVNGLPAIDGQLSVGVVYEQSDILKNRPSVRLFDPIRIQTGSLTNIPDAVKWYEDTVTSCRHFENAPPYIRERFKWNPNAVYDLAHGVTRELELSGQFIDEAGIDNYLWLNVMDARTRQFLTDDKLFPGGNDAYWKESILAMPTNVFEIVNEDIPHEHLALATTGKGAGWVTLVMNNSTDRDIVPSSEEVFMYTIKVEPELYVGTLHPILSDNPLDKLQDMKYTADFNGTPEQWEFEWIYSEPMTNGKADELPSTNSLGQVVSYNSWLQYGATDTSGLPRYDWMSVGDSGVFGLSDHYISCRYRAKEGTPAAELCGTNWTAWTKGQLAEGWIKRVLKAINPFEQRCMEYATKASSKELNTQLSMIQQAGAPYDGDVPLNQYALDDYGLLQFYETVLHQARELSIDANHQATKSLSLALQMAAGRISELYMVLGNEALADAMNPTVDLGTDSPVDDGAESSIFPFMNQCENLLDEELCLLRGRDLAEDYAYASRNRTEPWASPYYNRLIWNYSSDIMGGQVAYTLNYGISDLKGDNNGMTDVNDAIALYPQGHGDAYGHYLSAVKGYYTLLRHKNFGWPSQIESVLAYGGSALITMSYMHEKRFAMAAAAKARAAEMIASRTARQNYQQGAKDPWITGQDDGIEEFEYDDGTTDSRHWGTDEWATRGHLGAYYDWVVVNSVLPAARNQEVGLLQMIDRESTLELGEIAGYAKQIQQTADTADAGMNPLGLSDAAVPFDISPSEIDLGKTHFEQIYARALKATTVAHEVFKRVKGSANALRDQNESRDFDTMVADEEAAINRELIEIYGRPYVEDCGPGKIYPEGYTGPDLKHYYYVETYDIDQSNTNAVKGRYLNLVVNDYKLITTNCTGTFEAEFNKDVDADGVLNGLLQGVVKIYNTALNKLGDKLNPILKYGGVAVEDYLALPASIIDTGSDQYDGKVDYDFTVCAWSNVNYNASYFVGVDGFTPKPYNFTSQRPAEGLLQIALTGYQEKLTAVEEEQANVRTASTGIRELIDELWSQDYKTQIGYVQDAATNEVANYYAAVQKNAETVRSLLVNMKDIKKIVTESLVEAIPKITGLSFDLTSVARGALVALQAGLEEEINQQIKEQEEVAEKIKTETEKMQEKLEEQYKAYQGNEERQKKIAAIKEKASALAAAIAKLEVALNTANAQRMQYAQLLEKGRQLQNERTRKRIAWASDLSLQRYRNMFYQILRNDDLQRYNEAFESAAKYVYLAAKAYDYETGLLQSDSSNTAGREFMSQIIKTRALGRFAADGSPLGGGSAGDPGLADLLYRMGANWQVLKGRLGFNNPQNESDGFSLRQELFRKNADASGDAAWKTLLQSYWVDDLRTHPAFTRLAQPFDPMQPTEPGFVIPFRTEVTARNGFFGKALQAGDNAFSSTYFATKIRGVGIWFEGEKGRVANRPEVYLIPAGLDYMRVPVKSSSSAVAEIRSWKIVDQVLPIPYPLSDTQWETTDWSMMKDVFDNELCTQRRHPTIRASVAPTFEESAMSYNSRLIGRSVWNDQWWLIIPAASLDSNNANARANFVQTVRDIHLYLKTYSFSGN